MVKQPDPSLQSALAPLEEGQLFFLLKVSPQRGAKSLPNAILIMASGVVDLWSPSGILGVSLRTPT